jgi:hypothetical protein
VGEQGEQARGGGVEVVGGGGDEGVDTLQEAAWAGFAADPEPGEELAPTGEIVAVKGEVGGVGELREDVGGAGRAALAGAALHVFKDVVDVGLVVVAGRVGGGGVGRRAEVAELVGGVEVAVAAEDEGGGAELGAELGIGAGEGFAAGVVAQPTQRFALVFAREGGVGGQQALADEGGEGEGGGAEALQEGAPAAVGAGVEEAELQVRARGRGEAGGEVDAGREGGDRREQISVLGDIWICLVGQRTEERELGEGAAGGLVVGVEPGGGGEGVEQGGAGDRVDGELGEGAGDVGLGEAGGEAVRAEGGDRGAVALLELAEGVDQLGGAAQERDAEGVEGGV